MKNAATLLTVLLLSIAVSAQRPSDPALLVPQDAPAMDYAAVPSAVTLPEGVTMGAAAAVAFDARGHLWVLTRGAVAFFEFDDKGLLTTVWMSGAEQTMSGVRIAQLRFDRDDAGRVKGVRVRSASGCRDVKDGFANTTWVGRYTAQQPGA